MFFFLSTLLRFLAASAVISIPFAGAQTTDTEITAITDELYAKISPNAAPPGFNVGGGSVFTNFARAFKDKQLFKIESGSLLNEKPGSDSVRFTVLEWCSDLTFSDFSNSLLMGYAGRCVKMSHKQAVAKHTLGISAVFVEQQQQNIFQGQLHSNTDDFVDRYWDDGRKTMPWIAWEGHDEGDIAASAATSSLSAFGEITWMSVEEVAQLLNKSADEFTPEKFKQVYMDTWIKQHEKEAAENNPNPESEQEIIEEVKNETDSTGETTSSAEPGTGDGGTVTGPATPIEDDSSSGRKLASVAARFVSAALRVLGI